MKVTVRYFASLREQMGRAEDVLSVEGDVLTVAELWRGYISSQPMGQNILIAVNMEYANVDVQVHDGDEVAFFPPVTGG